MSNYLEISYFKNTEQLNKAFEYCSSAFSHEEIINELHNNDDLKKQICIIELSCLKNCSEAEILVFNLTGHAGPVRETASFKILELIQNSKFHPFFQSQEIYDAFIKAVSDINPSVSRNACRIIQYADKPEYIFDSLLRTAETALNELECADKNRSYDLNKKNFKLYWTLEALSALAARMNAAEPPCALKNALTNILTRAACSNDYTIREKTAKTACGYNIKEVLELLENDENIYVQRSLCI